MITHSTTLRAALAALLLVGGTALSQAADKPPTVGKVEIVQNVTTPDKAETTAASDAKAVEAPKATVTAEKAAETAKTADEAAAAPAETVRIDPLAGHNPEIIKKYYLTDGKTYTQTTDLVKNLAPELTGLDAKDGDYYLRVDKKLTDKYFRHVRAYDTATHVEKGDYLVAKDQTSVWRIDGDKPGMIYGSAEKLLKKSKLVVYPRYLALGSKGLVGMAVPGNVPATMKAKSLNESIARVDDKNYIIPVATGKVDIMADYVLGDQKGTVVRQISVVTKEDLQRMAYAAYLRQIYFDRMWYDDPWPFWGGYYGYHHHHHHHAPPPRRHGHRPPPPHRHR